MKGRKQPRDHVIDESLPKAEQERRVEDEIQKSDEELFGRKSERPRRQSRP